MVYCTESFEYHWVYVPFSGGHTSSNTGPKWDSNHFSQPSQSCHPLKCKNSIKSCLVTILLILFFPKTFAKCKVICERDTKSHVRHITFPVPVHTLTKDSHNTWNFMPCSFRIVCGFFNVTQWTYKHGRYLWDRTYSLSSLCEKTWKSNHLLI